jgi:alpha-galactosidase
MKPALLSYAVLLSAFPLAAQTTRIEDNDPSVVYTGNWYSNGSSANSGGHATLTNALNARADITFTGTGISWIGVADPWSGFCRVYLDGVLNTVDTYGSATMYQKVLFTARGLAPGPHTLSIQVMHSRDVDGSGSWVWIDAFDIENGSGVTGGISAPTGRTEQNNPAVNYNGVWYLNTNPVQSGGTAVLSTDANSAATITFTGTAINWIAYRDAWSGIATIIVDGTQTASVDTYSPTDQAQAVGYSVTGLSPGTHTLTIQVTGTHSAASRGSWIWVDAFDVSGGQ